MARRNLHSLADNEEVELKLAVVGDDPAATLARIGTLDALGEYRLGPPSSHRIHDLYWDTADGQLRERGISFRVREIDGATRFTLKGNSSSDRGLFRRQELELLADAASWQTINAELQAAGITVATLAPNGGDPTAWPVSAGLRLTQDRVTERVVRLLYPAGDKERRAVAELALDTTRFRFGDQTVEYREVEIEQLVEGAVSFGSLAVLLQKLEAGRLEPATMGKYRRGLRLERQLKATGTSTGEHQ